MEIKKYYRANHAHKKCNQILIPLFGKIRVDIITKNKNKKFILSHKKNNYLNVPKKLD